MSIQKTCKQCQAKFEITDDDLAFYKKISPIFTGKTYEIPPPTLCPQCRDIRRSSFRNERSLYKRKSDKSGEEIVSVYSPDKTDYKVYDISEWWADDWDALNYGRDFDFSRPFFEQFKELLKDVPRISLFNTNTENCEFANFVDGIKNCYMSMVTYYGTENSHYCYRAYTSKDNLDLNFAVGCERCYECVFINKCYNCRYSLRLENCRDCYFCADLTACSDCLFCSNLKHKQYYIRNKPYSREDYRAELKKYIFDSRSKIAKCRKEFDELRKNSVVKFANQIRCENCIGDDLIDCKNVRLGFDVTNSQDCKYVVGEKFQNIMDGRGGSLDWSYEFNHAGFGSNISFSSGMIRCSFCNLCENCHNSHNLFGCVGLQHKEYCVFNKQYSKAEYEKLAAKIIEKMQETGEWGEFFPNGTSPFGYNETIANRLFPKSREEALKIGMKWQDKDYSLKFDGEFYEPADNVAEYANSEEKQKGLLAGVLKCEKTGKAFKIMPQELAFYIENKIPVPTKHYDARYNDRLALEFGRKLWHRQCMCEESGHDHEGKCKKEFETTYAPDRPEKVYCENCYQKSVI